MWMYMYESKSEHGNESACLWNKYSWYLQQQTSFISFPSSASGLDVKYVSSDLTFSTSV